MNEYYYSDTRWNILKDICLSFKFVYIFTGAAEVIEFREIRFTHWKLHCTHSFVNLQKSTSTYEFMGSLNVRELWEYTKMYIFFI